MTIGALWCAASIQEPWIAPDLTVSRGVAACSVSATDLTNLSKLVMRIFKRLSQLLKAEMAEPVIRSIAHHMKTTRLLAYKHISGYGFAASAINATTARHLHRCPRRRAWQRQNTASNCSRRPGPSVGSKL